MWEQRIEKEWQGKGGKRRRRGVRILLKVTVGTVIAIAMAIHFDACTFHFTAHFHFILFPPTPTLTFIYSLLSNYSAVSYRACHFGYWLIKKQQNSGLDGIISNCCCCCCCHCFCFCCFNCCLLLAKIHGRKAGAIAKKRKQKKQRSREELKKHSRAEEISTSYFPNDLINLLSLWRRATNVLFVASWNSKGPLQQKVNKRSKNRRTTTGAHPPRLHLLGLLRLRVLLQHRLRLLTGR